MKIRNAPIIWTEAMLTGVTAIDEQHQILVNMVNVANEKLAKDISRNTLVGIIHDLMSYAVYHFDTEEKLMVENTYPVDDKQQHFQEHRGFSAKVASLHQHVSQGELISREELLEFLNDWLINHIMHSDKKLGDFLTNK